MNELTIGKSELCDIVIADEYVNKVHARMTIENGMYFYQDMSMNGTVINGTIIRNAGIYVNIGDVIVVAPDVKLSWAQIQSLMPLRVDGVSQSGAQPNGAANQNMGAVKAMQEPKSIDSWSWGGFFFGWLWAVCNGIYWPLVVFIPIVGWLSAIVINIILGIKGKRWAWENRTWRDAEHFERAQHQWSIAALVFFVALMCFIGLCVAFGFAMFGLSLASGM